MLSWNPDLLAPKLCISINTSKGSLSLSIKSSGKNTWVLFDKREFLCENYYPAFSCLSAKQTHMKIIILQSKDAIISHTCLWVGCNVLKLSWEVWTYSTEHSFLNSTPGVGLPLFLTSFCLILSAFHCQVLVIPVATCQSHGVVELDTFLLGCSVVLVII